MKKIISFFVFFLLGSIVSIAQESPIKWSSSVEMSSESEGKLIFEVAISKGWHMYAFNQPEGGPKSTNISFENPEKIEFIGDYKFSSEPIKTFDKMFNLDLTWWDSDVKIERQFKLKDKSIAEVQGRIEYQGCNDKSCIAPQKEILLLR